MQVTSPSPLPKSLESTGQGKRKSSSARSQSSQPRSKDKAAAPPELLESFTRETREQQELHLRAEHQAQLQTQDVLHNGRIAAMFEQLQTTLFTLWSDVWQQRRKAQDQAFKEWLKLLTS